MRKWTLTYDNFNYVDRLKISAFLLNKKNLWTRSKQTEKLECELKHFLHLPCDQPEPVFVSSGSTANTLLAMYYKDYGFWGPKKNKILVPSTTWATSISPWIREGFEPIFVDVRQKDLFIDTTKCERLINERDDICGVFPTTILGWKPELNSLRRFIKFIKQSEKQIFFAMDNCESMLSSNVFFLDQPICSTTSSYFSHFLQSVEGGFIFPKDYRQRDYFLSAMNHGMTRFMENKGMRNKDADPMFDFLHVGNNFRNSDINAKIGRLSLKKLRKDADHRYDIYRYFLSKIDNTKDSKLFLNKSWLLPLYENTVPFALPMVFKSREIKLVIKVLLNKSGIETRPLISGNLTRHNAFKKYNSDKMEKYHNSDHLHDHGLYVGLHRGVNKKHIDKLIEIISK